MSARAMTVLRQRLRERGRDEGVSLIELLVVMLLSSFILAIVGTLFINVALKTSESVDVRDSTADASNIMNGVSTTVRGAVPIDVQPQANGTPNPKKPPVLTAGSSSLVIFSYTDAGPSFPVPLQIRYRVDTGGRMIEDRWVATGCTLTNPSACVATYPTYKNPATTTPDATRVLGNVVMNTTACAASNPGCSLEPLFRYYDICENQLGTDKDGAQAAIEDVAWIEFNVRVRASDSAEDVRLVNRIGLGNTGDRIPVGGCP